VAVGAEAFDVLSDLIVMSFSNCPRHSRYMLSQLKPRISSGTSQHPPWPRLLPHFQYFD
jgi:hypothetical protein